MSKRSIVKENFAFENGFGFGPKLEISVGSVAVSKKGQKRGYRKKALPDLKLSAISNPDFHKLIMKKTRPSVTRPFLLVT